MDKAFALIPACFLQSGVKTLFTPNRKFQNFIQRQKIPEYLLRYAGKMDPLLNVDIRIGYHVNFYFAAGAGAAASGALT